MLEELLKNQEQMEYVEMQKVGSTQLKDLNRLCEKDCKNCSDIHLSMCISFRDLKIVSLIVSVSASLICFFIKKTISNFNSVDSTSFSIAFICLLILFRTTARLSTFLPTTTLLCNLSLFVSNLITNRGVANIRFGAPFLKENL